MRKSKKFIGMPVISLAEGQQIGTVKGLVVDPEQQKVAALIIEQKGWFREQKFAPYGKVRSVGNDAITLDQSSQVEKGSSLPEILNLYKEKVSLIGCKVLSENGSQLGQVEEYFIEEVEGNIVGLELSGNLLNSLIKGRSFLDISFVKTLGKELVVTTNDAYDSLVKIDGGIQETVKQLKDSTSHIWESTVQKTKELGVKTKVLGSKTKDELENKSKELTSLTKDLGESLNRQLDKVRGNKEQPSENEKESSRNFAPVEDKVQVSDLPAEVQLTRTEEPSNPDGTRSFAPTEDQIQVSDLPPELHSRSEADSDAAKNSEPEVSSVSPEQEAKKADNPENK